MVYVDNMQHPYGRMLMCHMIADTSKELLDMADKIGVQRKWIQHPGTNKEHFDICMSKRAKAIKLGAKEVTQKEIVKLRFYKIEPIKPK
jgi:hypothetical protein